MADTTLESLDELRTVIRNCAIIDNHAHNLLRLPQLKSAELLSSTSEADGEALQDHINALPHFRAARQLRQLYDLTKDADWDRILKKRKELLDTDANGLIKRCLAGTYSILIDDGLEGSFENYSWHDQFVLAPCKRIVRIEAVAADILSSLHQQGKLPVGTAAADEEACQVAWLAFISAFEQAIAALVVDKEVAGFKSVVCYRTGLDIEVGRDVEVTERGLRSFRRHFLPHCVHSKFRVETKGMNDALVISACKLIEADFRDNSTAKPLQFHTGLGDNDISLLDSNPACLQPLMKHFPFVPIVLLHSSYPYTREAGYLATVYKNVYLDIGEVFPMVSRDGQEQILRQALEITPTSKILWSTDGHHHPETYWLANVQGREVIETVLCSYVQKEDLTVPQAIRAVKSIFFENSNRLYALGLELPNIGDGNDLLACEDGVKSTSKSSRGAIVGQPVPQSSGSARELVAGNAMPKDWTVDYVFIQWLDYMAQMRSRWLPRLEYQKLMSPDGLGRLAISKGNLGTTQNDHMSSVCEPVGSIYVEPDLRSVRPMQNTGPVKNAATMMAKFTDEDGVGLNACPRHTLETIVGNYEKLGVSLLAGFEIEITFCRSTSNAEEPFAPLDTIHAWGTFTNEQYMTSVGLMTSIASSLEAINIPVQQLHSEAGAGQYEFVLPPLPPVQAVDTLVQAKQCIQQIAVTKGLRATCHPMPFPGVGTAAHAHISLNSSSLASDDLARKEKSFAAAFLEHVGALCAVTMPQTVSYGRVVDDSWTGGTWVAWGTNNRETPLRRVCPGRWEIRCLDGTANMYLALACVLGVGLDGINRKAELAMKDCYTNPTKLSDERKQELGITKRMPRSLEESLEMLEKDEVLLDAVGLLRDWIEVKKAEQDMLGEMDEKERRLWLMERY